MARKELAGLDLGGTKITNLATPTGNTDAATKAYADSVGGGGGGGGIEYVRYDMTDSNNYTVEPDATYVAQTVDLTAGHFVYLPLSTDCQPGQVIRIADETGTCNANSVLQIWAQTPDTMNNGLFSLVVQMTAPFQWMDAVTDGAGTWTMYDAYNTSHPGVAYTQLTPGDGIQMASVLGNLQISNLAATHTAVRDADTVLTNNNASFTVADSQLTVPMLATTTYWLDALIGYNVAVLADMRMGWAFPFGTTGTWEASDQIVRGISTLAQTRGVLGTADNVTTRVSGHVTTSTTSGSLGFRACQNTAQVSDLTILAGSRVVLTKLGIAAGT